MYCPNCRAEYRPGFTECYDCQVPLVDELPDEVPKTKASLRPFVQVYSASHHDAQLIRSLLEGNGIDTVVKNEGSAAYVVHVGAMGESRVFVPETDAARAVELIKIALQGELELSEGDPE